MAEAEQRELLVEIRKGEADIHAEMKQELQQMAESRRMSRNEKKRKKRKNKEDDEPEAPGGTKAPQQE